MKLIGYIVEQKNGFRLGTETEVFIWEHFSRKIYSTKEIAEDAYNQSPYKNGVNGWSMAGRIIPVYRNEDEQPILIKN
jgi:hypothetical protein